jgi:hypothetical protein
MKIELTEENARRLLWVANLLEIDAEELLNGWMLSDWLKDFEDATTGNLRELYNEIRYADEKTAKRAAVRVMSYERQQFDDGFPFLEIRAREE